MNNGRVATIQLRNLPDELHQGLAARATARGQSMTQYLTDLLREDLARPSLDQWLTDSQDALGERTPIDISVAEMMAETRPVSKRS
jgi:plasmid stability protein